MSKKVKLFMISESKLGYEIYTQLQKIFRYGFVILNYTKIYLTGVVLVLV